MKIGDRIQCCENGMWFGPMGPYDRAWQTCPRCHGQTYTIANRVDVIDFERKRNKYGCEPAYLQRCKTKKEDQMVSIRSFLGDKCSEQC